MRVFVTGGSGFIGNALVRRLRRQGHEVRALTRSERAKAIVTEADAISVQGDITQPGSWQDEVRFGDVVVHAAAFVSDWGPRREFYRVNVDGTKNILDALKKWDGHFIHISSIAVHGFRPGTYTEASPASPDRHPYCDSKARAERLVDMAIKEGLKASLARVAGVYGPGDPHFIARFLDQVRSGRIFIVGKGDQPSNLIYIDDIIEGMILIAKRECEPGQRYVLSDPSAPDVLIMIQHALTGLELRARIQPVPMWIAMAVASVQEMRSHIAKSHPSLTRYAVKAIGNRCVFSTGVTAKKLGWSPKMNVQEGVARTISWYRKINPSLRPSTTPVQHS
jgi:nucleoside-diphosphate-sugar epimerase